MLSRVLGNLGLRPKTPLIEWFHEPVNTDQKDSVVRNGDFVHDEDSDGLPDGWQFICEVQGARCAILEDPALPPRTHLCLEVSSVAAGYRTTAMLAQHGVSIQKGQWYRLSFWARAEDLSSRQAWIAVQDTTRWQPLLEYQRFVPGEKWKHYVYLVTGRATESQNTRLQIWFDGSGKLYIADVQLVPCDPPTQGRWLEGLYLDTPQEWDDPYRFFRW